MGRDIEEVRLGLGRIGKWAGDFSQARVFSGNKSTEFGKGIVKEARGADVKRELSQGFCRGACLNWVRRTVLGGHKGYSPYKEKKDDGGREKGPEHAYQFKQMSIAHVEQVRASLGTGATLKQWKGFAETVDKRIQEGRHGNQAPKRKFGDIEPVFNVPSRGEWQSVEPDAMGDSCVGEIEEGFDRCRKLVLDGASLGVLIALELKPSPHAVAVHRSLSSESCEFFDPNYGTLLLKDMAALKRVFDYLFTLDKAKNGDFAKPVYAEDAKDEIGDGMNFVIFAASRSVLKNRAEAGPATT